MTTPERNLLRKRDFAEAHEEDDAPNEEPERPTNRPRLTDKLTATDAQYPALPARPTRSISPEHESLTFLPYPSLSSKSSTRTPFQQPSPVLSFSYTPITHTQEFNNSALKAYVDPPPGADLNYGYERWLRKPDERGRLDGLLAALRKVKENEAMSGQDKDIGAVAWRGIITKILTAPYENRDGWELNVMVVNGTLYLEEHLTDAKLKEKNNMDPRQHKQSYYGYAFESYCAKSMSPDTAGDTQRHPPGWNGDVDTNEQWCSVVRTKLGDVRLLVGGEVDCVRGHYTGRLTDNLVELKTSMAIRGPQDEARFEKKLLKFYFQSFLLGVPEIMVGFRTPAGRLTTMQSFRTLELPRMVREKPGAWDPQVCLDWGWKVLAALREAGAAEAQPKDSRVWRATFVPGQGVRIRLLDEEEVRDVERDGDSTDVQRVGFLPRWYWEGEVGSSQSIETQ